MKLTSAQVAARVEVVLEGASPALGYPEGSYVAASDDNFDELIEAAEKLVRDARDARAASLKS